MDDDFNDSMTLEDFQRWKVVDIKNYLTDRGLPKSNKTKTELVALAYSAHIQGTLCVNTVSEERKQRAAEYRELLKVDGDYLPDPLVDLEEDTWQRESQSVMNWPPISYIEIAQYLTVPARLPSISSSTTVPPLPPGQTVQEQAFQQQVEQGRALSSRMLSDYKEGKAYSYFDADWLREVWYHPISPSSPFCVLKAECMPSERIKDPPHDVWVIVEKTTGRVRSAHCGCFAGLGSTCNHVAAVLFKADYAFMRGWTTLSCTSRPCEWNTYKGGAEAKKLLEGTRISDMKWRKPDYKKKGSRTIINPPARQLFQPSTKYKPSISSLTNGLFQTLKGSCIEPYIKFDRVANYRVFDDVNVADTVECSTSSEPVLPPTMLEMASRFPNDREQFLEFVLQHETTVEEVQLLHDLTIGQAMVPLWHAQRQGLITGSKIHSVLTRMRTVRRDPNADCSNLIANIMGYAPVDPSLPALKFGRLQEPHAKAAYSKSYVEDHINATISDAGLFLRPGLPGIIGASPDGLVDCDCCGHGLIEIKCPISIVGEIPTAKNLQYLTEENGKLKLKRGHSYYSQIIFQLHIAQREWCDFYIYTGDHSYTERIFRDDEVWNSLKEAATYFFAFFLSHELVGGVVKEQIKKGEKPRKTATMPSTAAVASSVMTPPEPPKKKTRRKVKKVKTKPLYVCALCTEICKEGGTFEDDKENSVQCDSCRMWFHWGCVSFVDNDDDAEWLCDECLA